MSGCGAAGRGARRVFDPQLLFTLCATNYNDPKTTSNMSKYWIGKLC